MIVRRESEGFGFTLTQQMPVFVDKVFPGSSAEKARVLVGDRILKVLCKHTITYLQEFRGLAKLLFEDLLSHWLYMYHP